MYAVLFDIDGTLIDSGGAGKHAFAETFAEDFAVPEIHTEVPFAGRSDRAITMELMARHEVDPTEENWQRFAVGYGRRLKGALERCQGKVLPGVVALLDELQQIDRVVLGLLTGNIRKGARAKLLHYGLVDPKLLHYGLVDRFAFGGYGDDHDDRNDIAAAAVRAAKEYVAKEVANGPLLGTMVIGDTINDVRCGQSVGAYTVAVATGGSSFEQLREAEPDLLVKELVDSQEMLAEVRGGDAVAR